MAKEIFQIDSIRQNMTQAIRTIQSTVGCTMGPRGKTVCIERSFGSPILTKDGVTVAKNLEFSDNISNTLCKIIVQAAIKSNDDSGDGTTGSTILVCSMLLEAMKATAAGRNPMDLRRGMEKAGDIVEEYIDSIKKSVSSQEAIEQVATVSSNGDKEIGAMIANAMQKVGRDGTITIEEGKDTRKLHLDVVQGMQFDRGYQSPYFITNQEKMLCELENPLILICDQKISSVQPILPLLEGVAKSQKSLLIIAEETEGEALTTLVVNKLRGVMKVAAIKAPGFGDRKKDILDDIAVITGGRVISEAKGDKLEEIEQSDLGSAKKIILHKENITIVDGNGEKSAIDTRVKQVKQFISDSTSDYDKEKAQERLAKLTGGVGVLRVGGNTEVEAKERKDRADDALNATKSAVVSGIVAGGGVALLNASVSKKLTDLKGVNEDENEGINIVRKSLSMPAKYIVNNSGLDGVVIIAKLLEAKDSDMIFNSQTFQYGDAFKLGIIDSAAVIANALRNAISVASTLTTTDSFVLEKPKENGSEDNAAAGGGMPHGGGMMGGGMPGMGGF